MKMKKRFLSLVLSAAMVLGSFTMAFAAAPSAELTANVENKDVSRAVERLAAFGIVNGMEDGEYHPELDVTREQFAKLVVEALGLGDAAKSVVSDSAFTDVEAGRWSAGYISIASGQGIVKGMGDGTFHPADKVTYAEAVTMLVRALGYKDEFLPGSWPGNYVAKAAELDVTDDVEFTPTGTANRGDVAMLVNNTLDAKIVKVRDYEGGTINFTESDETLLEDKLDATKVEDLRVIANSRLNDSLDTDEVEVLVLADGVEIDGTEYDLDRDDKGDVIKLNVDTDMVDTEALLGMEVTAYLDGKDLVYAEVETDAEDVFRCVTYDDEGDGTMIIWDAPIEFYDFNENVEVYINGKNRTSEIKAYKNEEEGIDNPGLEGNRFGNANELYEKINKMDPSYGFANRVVVENDEIVYLDVAVPEKINMVVTDVDVDDEVIEYSETYVGGTNSIDDEQELDLSDYDEYDIFTQDGKELTLEEIEKKDVIYFYEDAKDKDIAHILVASNEAVTGELDSVRVGVEGAGFNRSKITVDGESYSVASGFAYSTDDMDEIKGINKYTNLDETFDDVFGEEVEILRDLKGRVALLNTEVDATISQYGVILGADEAFGDIDLKIWTTNGIKATYEYDTESVVKIDDMIKKDGIDSINGSIVEYDLNSNGDEIEILQILKPDTAKQITIKKINEDSIKTDDGIYYQTSDSVFLDYSDYAKDEKRDEDDLEVIDWNDIADNGDVDGEPKALVFGDKDRAKDIELMVFVKSFDGITDEDMLEGYVTKVTRKDDSKTVVIDVVGEGEKEYTIDDSDKETYDAIRAEQLIVFKESAGGIKIKGVGDGTDYEQFGNASESVLKDARLVTDRDGRYLTVIDVTYNETTGNVALGTTPKEFKISSDAVVYNDDDKAKYTDLDFGYLVQYLVKDGEIIAIKYWEDEDVKGTKLELQGDKKKYSLKNQ